jgi:hypothetical protein
MKAYTQSELYRLLTDYLKKEKTLTAKAKAAVVEWRYAREQMYHLFPLSSVIGFRGSSKWQKAPTRWLKEPEEPCHHHGFDTQSNVVIITHQNGLTSVFVRNNDIIDEIVFGGCGTSLKRHLYQKGRAVAVYDYSLSPHQYSLETFKYTGDRLMKSVEQGWYLSDDVWKKASSTVFLYEYDDAGLLRVVRDMGGHLGKDVVFIRPKSGILKKANKPRPLVAYTNASNIQSDAYGLEMNIDDEWPIDTVIFVPPDQITEATRNTSVTTMGTVSVGASEMPTVNELKRIKKSGGTWVLFNANHTSASANLAAALDAGLKVMLLATDGAGARIALADTTINTANLVIAFRPGKARSPEGAQAIAARIRAVLKEKGASTSRIVLAAPIRKEEIMAYLTKPDIDGVLHENGSFEWAMEVLVPIALHIATEKDRKSSVCSS